MFLNVLAWACRATLGQLCFLLENPRCMLDRPMCFIYIECSPTPQARVLRQGEVIITARRSSYILNKLWRDTINLNNVVCNHYSGEKKTKDLWGKFFDF